MANKHVNGKIINVKQQEEEEREHNPRASLLNDQEKISTILV